MKRIPNALIGVSLLAFAAGVHADDAASMEVLTVDEGNIAMVELGEAIAVAKVDDADALLNPNDPLWQNVPESGIEVAPAPAVHESVELRIDYDQEPQTVYVAMAQSDSRVFVRLRWSDATKDIMTDSNHFRDGAAVQFSLGDSDTSFMMGSDAESPVNIWYWRSDGDQFQNLAAGGPGSTTMLDEQNLTGGSGYYQDAAGENQWAVVISREIESSGEHNVSFDQAEIPVAFAFWQGADQQRDGYKNATYDWYIAQFQ